MTEKNVKTIKDAISSKKDGKLRKVFYGRNGLPKQGLYTNDGILKKCGIDVTALDELQYMGVLRILGSKLCFLRNEAKDAGLAWIDFKIKKSNGTTIAHHGYMADPNKILSNAADFESIADKAKYRATQTREIADIVLIDA